jgi:two-component system sensor histidine kinase KdpD
MSPADSTSVPDRNWLAVLKPYLAALAVVAFCSGLAWFTWEIGLAAANIIMVFLAGVALIAWRYGHGPSIFASILSVLVFDYFFVEPVFLFVPTDAEYIVDMAAMLGIGVIISELTARLRSQVRIARQHEQAAQKQEQTTAQLYGMTRRLSESAGLEYIISTAGQQLTEIFTSDVVIFSTDNAGRFHPKFGKDSPILQFEPNVSAARWANENGKIAGFGSEQFSDATALFVPMTGFSRVLGVLGVQTTEAVSFADPERRRLLETCAQLIALSMERDQSSVAVQEAQLQIKTEQFRNYVLSSISHDLRSPLSIIATAASSLLEESSEKSEPVAQDRLKIVVDESHRLARRVENLLANARMTSGPIVLNRQWHSADELIEVVLTRLQTELGDRDVQVHIDDDVPMLWIEGNLMEQVFMNLLENAIHYTPADSQIIISARHSGDQIELSVADNGPGFPAGYETKLFEKFFRPPRSAEGRRGIGLGLAICKAIVNAHEGQIRAANRTEGGAQFTIALPCPLQNPDDMLEEGELEEPDLLENRPPC